jgi:hypothetical protein
MNKRFLSFASRLIVLIFLISLACNLPLVGGTPQATPLPGETQTVTQAATPGENPTPTGETHGLSVSRDQIYPPPFAEYTDLTISYPSSYSGSDYSLPVDLGQVSGIDNFAFSDAQRSLLSSNGFVVEPPEVGQYREFYQIYESSRYDMTPVFITTDSVFHVYHLIFDKMLRDLETQTFLPTLNTLTSAMLQASYQQYQSLLGTSLEEPALRNVAFFGVAARLLNLSDAIPNEASALVDAEVALIEAAGGPAISPIWDRSDLPEDKKLIEDYSQYIVRGHYTRSEELGRYFKTMMWYGRLTFRLRDDFETRRALLLTQAMRSTNDAQGVPVLDDWHLIYDPTTFIVGKSDDLSYVEYGKISDLVYGANPDLTAFADDNMLATFKATAQDLPAPQVNSMWVWIWEDRTEATQGFRVMGQRFTLDEYIFGQLMWRNVGTLDNPRDLPLALDFFAAMGSDEALQILTDLGEPNYENYSSQMDKVRTEVASLDTDSWTQNVYWTWLYTFQSLISVKDSRFPQFMQTQAWRRKDLNTALGSFTELKHDTILYAKQVMAELGGGLGEEQPPKGYVEPNPEVYARLYALSSMTYNGLDNRGILSDLTRRNLENLMDLLTFLKSASERQMAGEDLTTDEYWRIQFYGGELEAYTLAAADTTDEMSRDLSDQKAALIADIATGIGRVLEEAIGRPTRIYLVIPDQPWRIAVGGVYSYYEFQVEPSGRMTDEQWQALIESGPLPAQPSWIDAFMTP